MNGEGINGEYNGLKLQLYCNPYNKKRTKHRCKCLILKCAPLGARTLDTLIKSQVLYQLS